MGITAVLLVNNPSPTLISHFHDQLSNQLPTFLGKWSFDCKIYRENPASAPNQAPGLAGSSSEGAKLLFTLNFTHFPGETVCIANGSGVILQGDFEKQLSTKLQSLWTLRQTIRGEGNSYELGEFRIRTGNMTLQGSFKGLVIEIEYVKEVRFGNQQSGKALEDVELGFQKIRKFVSQGVFPQGQLIESSRPNDEPDRLRTAWQYVEALR